MNTPNWKLDGACNNYDPDQWYSTKRVDVDETRTICNTCPVIETCRTEGINELWGMWGGLDELQRQDIRTQRQKETPTHEIDESAIQLATTRQLPASDLNHAERETLVHRLWHLGATATAERTGLPPRTVQRIRARIKRNTTTQPAA